MLRKLLFLFFLLLIAVAGLYLFRTSILRSFATGLIEEDSLQRTEALFILSGGGYDRGNEAVRVFNAGYVSKIICTGGNSVMELCALDIDTLESYMTASNLRQHGVPDSCVEVIRNGTSTREEAKIILDYCLQNKLRKVMVLSSRLHTHRVNKVFRKKMEEAGIELVVHGAPSSGFKELEWWKDENGMIAVNNEWLKTVYYWWKY